VEPVFLTTVAKFSLFTSIFLSLDLVAATLPSRMPFSGKPKDTVDPELESWMRAHSDLIPVAEMTSDQVLVWVTDKDPVAKALIVLESGGSSVAGVTKQIQGKSVVSSTAGNAALDSLRAQTIKDVPKIIKNELSKPASDRSPMLADLYLEWLPLSGAQDESGEFAERIFKEEPVNSCSSKARTVAAMTKDKLAGMNTEQILEAIRQSKSYRSMTHRRRYLESIAASIPESKRQEVIKEFRAYAQDLPLLLRRFPWLQEDDLARAPASTIFLDIGRQVRRKKCKDAEHSFQKILETQLPKESLEYAVDAGTEIERCYRAERRAASVAFWQRMVPKMEKTYGKSGALWVKVRQGYLKWVTAELDEANKILQQIIKEATPATEYQAVIAKAIYMQGKVAEDQGDLDHASKFFANYVDRFPTEEDFELAFNSLVVNFAAKKQWKEMLVPLEKFMADQSKVHMDKRPVGLTAFTMFWLGRAQLHLGRVDLAKDIWRRLAGEYYSTFYGAMGHYLLEQTSGQSFALEPSRVSGFNFAELEFPLSAENKKASRRAVAFLRAGFPAKARCEVEELVAASETDYETMLIRTLLLHASGSWLDAIKIFDVIPRSVRNGLPVGFERVLFPRKYVDIVKTKAEKLDMDPDFVFALMRQESVFAPDATSPVGATGLMQLMPSTAKLEANKLSGDYIDGEGRSAILQALGNESSLRDPEINVTLGVHHLWRLMKTYKSPVFALTAYNASPAATVKWQKTIASDDWLTFIERIPYKETRSYVKLILRNYFYYKRWYNIPDGKSQIHIDTVVEDLINLAKSGQAGKPSSGH
jgi:tetratricopeptide (TPR) repeat protein